MAAGLVDEVKLKVICCPLRVLMDSLLRVEQAVVQSDIGQLYDCTISSIDLRADALAAPAHLYSSLWSACEPHFLDDI